MSTRLTKKQKGFAKDYLDTGNGTQSVLKNYDVEGKDPAKIASVMAVEILGKPSVQEYLESHADKAAERVVELSNQSENLTVSLGASKDILDRSGFKPIERTETKTLNVEVKLENKDLEDIRVKYESELKAKLLQ